MKLKRITTLIAVLAAFALIFGSTAAPASAAAVGPTSQIADVVDANAAFDSLVPGRNLSQAGIVSPKDPTGQYYAYCINFAGATYPWAVSNIGSCPGYADVYISGQHIAHINTGAGSMPTWSCLGGIALGLVTLFAPGGLEVGWALAGTLAGFGITIAGCAGV